MRSQQCQQQKTSSRIFLLAQRLGIFTIFAIVFVRAIPYLLQPFQLNSAGLRSHECMSKLPLCQGFHLRHIQAPVLCEAPPFCQPLYTCKTTCTCWWIETIAMTLLYWLIGVSKCTNFMWILIFLRRNQTGRAESTALVLTSCLGQKYSQAAAQSCFNL